MKMKKTLKIALLAILAVMSSTSVTAAELIGSSQYYKGVRYLIASINTTAKTGTVSVAQNDWVASAEDKTTLSIPDDIKFNIEGTISGTPFNGEVTFTVVEVENNAFKNLTDIKKVTIGTNVTTIGTSAFEGCSALTSFTVGANVTTIGADAFKGTGISTLDLSGSKLAVVNNLFGTSVAAATVAVSDPSDAGTAIIADADVTNTTLTRVDLPATMTQIVQGAFANCTKLATVTIAGHPVATQTIGKYAFYGTVIRTLDLSNTNITTLNPLFHYYNTKLNGVTLPSTITMLANYALADQIQLGEEGGSFTLSTRASGLTVNKANKWYAAGAAEQINDLTTIGKYAFGNTVLTELDFSKCYQLNFSDATPIFVTEAASTNSNLSTVKLPVYTEVKTAGGVISYRTPVTTLGITFANCKALTAIQGLDETRATTIVEYAFANDKVLPSLSFPGTVTSISGRPFAGCLALAELTIDGTAVTTIGGGTYNLFDAINQTDANTAWTGGVGFNAPIADAATSALVTLTITKDFTGTIYAPAFYAADSQIENVTISDGNDGATPTPNYYGISGTIEDGAIKLNPAGDNSVTIGYLKTGVVFSGTAVSIEGSTTGTTVLTIGNSEEDLSAITFPLVSGNISSATIGAISNDFAVDVLGSAGIINFAGDITATISNGGFVNNALTTINFDNASNVGYAITAAAIADATFDETKAPNLKKVYWHPAAANAVAAFGDSYVAGITPAAVFGTASVDAAAVVTLYTTEAVAALYPGNVQSPAILDDDLYNVLFDYETIIAIPTVNIPVFGAASASYYWGKFQPVVGTNYSIAAAQNGANVVVYSAYVDENTIYVDPLAKQNGVYVVEGGEAVIVRSTMGSNDKDVPTTNPVVAEVTTDQTTMRSLYDADAAAWYILNDLDINTTTYSSDDVATMYEAGKLIYAMANPISNNGLVFKYVKKTGYLNAGNIYVVKEFTNPDEILEAEASLRVVILGEDGTEDATFINGVEIEHGTSSAVKGAIYNLQGVRVNGAYKGIVIKDGKKYLQK